MPKPQRGDTYQPGASPRVPSHPKIQSPGNLARPTQPPRWQTRSHRRRPHLWRLPHLPPPPPHPHCRWALPRMAASTACPPKTSHPPLNSSATASSKPCATANTSAPDLKSPISDLKSEILLIPAPPKQSARSMRPLWRDLILEVWGADPLQCPCCKAPMKTRWGRQTP